MALLEANDNGYASFLFCIESLALRAEAFYRCIKEAEVSPFLKSFGFCRAIPPDCFPRSRKNWHGIWKMFQFLCQLFQVFIL